MKHILIVQIKKPSKSIYNIMKQTLNYAFQPITWITALLGVVAMEGFFRLAPRLGLSKIDNATPNGTYLLPPGKNASLVGFIMYYLGAIGLVSLFRSLRPKLKGSPSIQSLKFGTALYLFSSLAIMPFLGLTNPYMRQGVLKKPGLFGLGLEGWKTPVSNLVGHIIFSQVIGIKRLNKN